MRSSTLYAIEDLRFTIYLIDVWKAAGTAAKRATERVLLLSDCKPAMEQMERAWRKGEAHGMRGSDEAGRVQAL